MRTCSLTQVVGMEVGNLIMVKLRTILFFLWIGHRYLVLLDIGHRYRGNHRGGMDNRQEEVVDETPRTVPDTGRDAPVCPSAPLRHPRRPPAPANKLENYLV